MKGIIRQILPFLILLAMIVLWCILTPDTFLTWGNISDVLSRSAVNGIIAAGMTFVIITAGIDLSVGSVLAITGMLAAVSMLAAAGGDWAAIADGRHVEMGLHHMLIGSLAGIVGGALCGLFNGICITRLKLAPFIVTLGSMSIFRGAAYLVNNSRPFTIHDYSYLDTGSVCGLPSCVIIMVAVLVLCGFLLHRTAFGRYVYAIGCNPATAFYAGINVDKVIVWVYTLVGALTGLAALIYSSRASSAQPTGGISLELDVIAACIIGGCSPNGGKGTMVGTLVGTLLISFLRNGLALLGISSNVQLVVIGFIIIFAVTADRLINTMTRGSRSAA